ncbi:MAG TPA: 2-oxoacid:acceptor oxidoreductase family protein [Anaerolineae bacterium]|jgi:2-oxoglutarate ferredoxin oxidoreductase subunit gamma
MQHDVVLSGFGGQGALFAGQLLAYAAMDKGLFVTWIPSYGPEMRGGTANCTVIVSDEEIGSPIVNHPACVMAFNNPSVEKYEPLVATGGLLIYNASLTTYVITRPDIRAIPIQASEIAGELGNPRLLNMVMLGALLQLTDILPIDAVDTALESHMSSRRPELLALNRQALRRGMALASFAGAVA